MFNKCTFVGNIVRDPETRELDSGSLVSNFTVAVNNRRKEGETLFMRCTAWNKLAEIVKKYMHKSSKILVSGELRENSWEKDGEKHSYMELNVLDMEMLDGIKEKRKEDNTQTQEEDEKFNADNLPF